MEVRLAECETGEARRQWHSAVVAANAVMGRVAGADTLRCPSASLAGVAPRAFVLEQLVADAELCRADVLASSLGREVAGNGLLVARRSRRTDIDLSLEVSRNGRVRNEEAPAPPFTGVTVTVGVPLRFSNHNKGAVRAARLRAEQAETAYEQSRLRLRAELQDAYDGYVSSRELVRGYGSGVLAQAGDVLEGRMYSYSRGEVSLLEALEAQRAYNGVREGYVNALAAHAVALATLECAAGIWDVDLPLPGGTPRP